MGHLSLGINTSHLSLGPESQVSRGWGGISDNRKCWLPPT